MTHRQQVFIALLSGNVVFSSAVPAGTLETSMAVDVTGPAGYS